MKKSKIFMQETEEIFGVERKYVRENYVFEIVYYAKLLDIPSYIQQDKGVDVWRD